MDTFVLQLDRARAASATTGNGSWTCNIDGGLTLQEGDAVSLETCSIHQPGSSLADQDSVIVIPEGGIQATITYSFWVCDCRTRQAVQPGGVDQKPLIQPLNGALDPSFELQWLYQHGQPHIYERQMTIRVDAGSYAPARLAEIISDQTNTQVPTAGIPTRFSSATWVDGARLGFPVADIRFTTFPLAVDEDYELRPDVAANTFHFGSTEGLTFDWDTSAQAFKISYMHTPFMRQAAAGEPPKPTVALTQYGDGLRWAGADQGIGVFHGNWGWTEAEWTQSLWHLMGFSWEDLNGTQPDMFVTTMDALVSSMIPYYFNPVDTVADPLFFDSTGETAEPENNQPVVASSSPIRDTQGEGVWSVRANFLPTNWSVGDGTSASFTLGLVTRSYAANDAYIQQGGTPTWTVKQQTTLGSVKIDVLRQDGTLEDSLGEKSLVTLRVQRALQNQKS